MAPFNVAAVVMAISAQGGSAGWCRTIQVQLSVEIGHEAGDLAAITQEASVFSPSGNTAPDQLTFAPV